MGFSTSTQLLSLERTTPRAPVRERLRLGAADSVYAISRLRLIDGEPISLHRSYVPAQRAPRLDELDVINEQLCVVLEQNFQLAMSVVEEHLEAVAVDLGDARLLGLRRGDPVLRLTDVIQDRTGHPFEYSEIVFRGDRLQLRFDYTL
jgi:GntR family transcriptional regulator